MTIPGPKVSTPEPCALLDALDEAHAKATPGLWGVYWGDHIASGVVKTSPGGVHVQHDICEMQDEDDRACTDNAPNPSSPSADAALIVAAVNALPALTAAVRAALALADEMESDARTDRDTVLWVTAAFRAALSAPLGQPTTDESPTEGPRRPCPHGCPGGHTAEEYDGGGCGHRQIEPFEGWGR